MSTSYQKADDDVHAVIKRIMEKYHGKLADVGLRVDALMAYNDDGDAVKLHGRACYAKVRIINLRDRAKGMGDAEIIIDGKKWASMPPATQDALIDHELYHLQQKSSDKAGPLWDDLERPKLEIVPHDVEVGWFTAIAQRHAEASIEVQQATEIYGAHEQLLFSYAKRPKLPPGTTVTFTKPPRMAIAH